MKKYETPVVEIEKFAIEDIITTSSGGSTDDDNPGNTTPIRPF